MYLSEPERKELIKKLEEESKTNKYVNENFNEMLKNIMGGSTTVKPSVRQLKSSRTLAPG